MSNLVTGKIDFEAGGARYALHFTANGMCELEAAAGCTTMAFLRRLDGSAAADLSFTDVRLLFWAGLQEHHPELDVRAAGKVMTALGGLDKAMELVGRAVSASLPGPDGGGGDGRGKTAGTS